MDDNVFDSGLYDDEDDIIAAHGHDVSMGGLLADEEEEDPKDYLHLRVGKWPPDLKSWMNGVHTKSTLR